MAIEFDSSFIAGRYTATWNTVDLGTTEDGFEIEKTTFGEEMVGDNLGDTVQDIVYRGGNCFINFVLVEWNPGFTAQISGMFSRGTPEAIAGNYMGNHIGDVGFQWTKISNAGTATELVLTAIPDTTAATTPTSLTASLALIAPGFASRINFNNRHRKIPMRFQLLPYIPDSKYESLWFETVYGAS